jgi:putative ABC transport system permease protein
MQFKQIARRMARSPMFTAVTLATLAIGIGANTAIFSVISGVLIKPLPFRDPGQLVAVWQVALGIGMAEVQACPASYFTYREENKTFEDIGLWRGEAVTITGLAEPERVPSLVVTDGTLPILGVQPVLGRWFSRKDDSPGSPDTAILSYGFWQRRFGGDRSVIGRSVQVDGKPREIIGVLPRKFQFMNLHPAIVVPFQFNRNDAFIGDFSYYAIARLKPGVSLAQANTDVARMLQLMPSKFRPVPGISMKMLEQAHFGPNVRLLKNDVIGDIGNTLWVLMVTVGIVLLIACANVANLLLVRADGRQHELAVRAALGAGRARIARELLLESVTLGALGGVLGLGLANVALQLLVKLSPSNLPRLDEIAIDLPVLLFAIGVSLAAGLLFGILPAYKYAGPRVGIALREGGRNSSGGKDRHRARGVLVVAQVALALVLLVSSGLMIRTLQHLKNVQPGFTAPEQVLTVRVAIEEAQVRDAERVVRMHRDILDKIAAIPGVTAVAGSNSITMDGENDNDPVFAEDHPYAEGQLPPIRRFKFITPGAFHALGNPLLAGRDLSWTDIEQMRPVAVVSENLAREYWPNPSAALGRRIRESSKGQWREIIGVVGNERDDGVDRKAPAVVYLPFFLKSFWEKPFRVQRTLAFAVRSPRTGSTGFVKEIEKAVWSVNPDLPVANVRTVQEIYEKSLARTSFTLVLLAMAAGMALLLGVVGIYGVISYSVSQRTREIGIRIALGAQQSSVRRMFVRDGLLLTGIGVACGVAAAMAAMRMMKALLFEVSTLDPVTYCAVSLVLIAAALLATYLPARRATTIEPLEALRSE